MTSVTVPKSTIQDVITAGIDIATTVGRVTHAVTGFMDSMEATTESGKSKKEWVLVKMKDFIIEVGLNWRDWMEKIATLIDSIITVWNFFNGRHKI